jgi:hypothetical protein
LVSYVQFDRCLWFTPFYRGGPFVVVYRFRYAHFSIHRSQRKARVKSDLRMTIGNDSGTNVN